MKKEKKGNLEDRNGAEKSKNFLEFSQIANQIGAKVIELGLLKSFKFIFGLRQTNYFLFAKLDGVGGFQKPWKY